MHFPVHGFVWSKMRFEVLTLSLLVALMTCGCQDKRPSDDALRVAAAIDLVAEGSGELQANEVKIAAITHLDCEYRTRSLMTCTYEIADHFYSKRFMLASNGECESPRPL